MRKFCSIALLSMLIIVAVPAIANAHVLKVDGSIGAVLHINPDDQPTTNGPTHYVLAFDDDTGRFTLKNCTCTVSILDGTKILASNPLVTTSNEESDDTYTFTTPAVYTMRISGMPKQAHDFQPFTLAYEVRVTSGSSKTNQPLPVLLWIGIGCIIGLILLAAYAMS